MAQYSIGEVEQLTGIKPYVLRYWEEVIPCFSPRKDSGGRRIYSQHDLNMIKRLKYLIYTQRYTIDGARKQIILETEAQEAEAVTIQALHDIRSQLSELYLMLKHSGENSNK